MKRYKQFAIFLLTICIAFALAACGDSEPDVFTSLQSFEFHFFPEEYEEEYNEYEKTITLEEDREYQFQVNAACKSGKIAINMIYGNAEAKKYTVNSSVPCSDTISIPANITDTVCFTITITPETKGDVVVEVYVR